MTGSHSGLAWRTARCGCDSAYGIGAVARGGVAMLIAAWTSSSGTQTVVGQATVRRGSRRAALQVLRAPRAAALVGDEVVVHRGLAIVAEVQHAGAIVQEPVRVLKQS